MIQSKPSTLDEATDRAVSMANGTSQRYARHHHLVMSMGLTKMLRIHAPAEIEYIENRSWKRLTNNGKAVFDACKREALRQRRSKRSDNRAVTQGVCAHGVAGPCRECRS